MAQATGQLSDVQAGLQYLRLDQVERGIQHPAEKLVTLLNEDEWELLVRDWAEALTSKYHRVERIGGAGDQGRDVLGYTGEPADGLPWDNYQCKFYKDPLAPSDIWHELGKLCWFTYSGEFSVPRSYRFVSPQDVGTKLYKLLEDPVKLRAALVETWNKNCRDAITSTKKVELDGAFKQYVEGFDFKIVGYLPVRQLLNDIRGTPAYLQRFGGGLPARPPDETPPSEVRPTEVKYVRHLLDAYGDCTSCTFAQVGDIQTERHRKHFNRSREDFYRAESLRVFSRATVNEGTFEALQSEIYTGVIDICESDHDNGFECLIATAKAARDLQLTSNALISVLLPADRNEICHQLANIEQLVWVKR